jgi:hypothetical protein
MANSCAECGERLPEGARYCPKCGATVAGSGAAPLRSGSPGRSLILPLVGVALVALIVGAVLFWRAPRDNPVPLPADTATSAPMSTTAPTETAVPTHTPTDTPTPAPSSTATPTETATCTPIPTTSIPPTAGQSVPSPEPTVESTALLTPTVEPTEDPCAEHGGLEWAGQVCKGGIWEFDNEPGTWLNVILCNDGTKWEWYEEGSECWEYNDPGWDHDVPDSRRQPVGGESG